jgi:acyl carrier protein
MKNEEIRKLLCDVLAAIQADSGHPPPVLSDDTVPLADLSDFDSLACVDAEVRLSKVLGIEVEKIPFKSLETGREQTVREIVAHLSSEYGARIPSKTTRGVSEADQ